MQPHACTPATHYNFRHINSRKYVIDHHRGSFALKRATTIAQIQRNKKQLYGSEITYLAAYRCRQALQEELDGKEEYDFAKMEDLHNRTEAQDTLIRTKLVIDRTTDRFGCLFICLTAYRNAWQSICIRGGGHHGSLALDENSTTWLCCRRSYCLCLRLSSLSTMTTNITSLHTCNSLSSRCHLGEPQ